MNSLNGLSSNLELIHSNDYIGTKYKFIDNVRHSSINSYCSDRVDWRRIIEPAICITDNRPNDNSNNNDNNYNNYSK